MLAMEFLRKLRAIIKFAVVTLRGDDNGKFPIQQVSYNGRVADCFIVFPYGVHANLPADSLLTILQIGGHEENLVGFGGLPSERIKNLAEGEVVFFHPIKKSKIHFKKDGNIQIQSFGDLNVEVSGNVNIQAETANITATDSTFNGNLKVTENLEVLGSTSVAAITSNGKDISDQHKHKDTQPGTGLSGVVN